MSILNNHFLGFTLSDLERCNFLAVRSTGFRINFLSPRLRQGFGAVEEKIVRKDVEVCALDALMALDVDRHESDEGYDAHEGGDELRREAELDE
jgi:hypothetical protein